MERLRVVSTALLGLLILVSETHGSPFIFYEPDCYPQPQPEPPVGGYNYQPPDYQETLQEILRALQEIVYLTVRAAKEELTQLSALWMPSCDSGEYPGDATQGSEGGWDQGYPEHSTVGVASTLDIRFGTESTSSSFSSSSSSPSSSSSSETTTNGTREIITQNTTVTTQVPFVGFSNRTTSKAVDSTPLNVDEKQTTEYATEETTTDIVTLQNEIEV